MKLLKNRFVAFLISLAIVVSSTLISTNIKLGRLCDKVSDGFYGGVTYNGVEHKSVASQLRTISSVAVSLAELSADCGIDAADVIDAAEAMSIGISGCSVSENYLLYCELSDAVDKLYDSLSSAGLSALYSAKVEQCVLNMDNARRAIEESGYNESVREFCREKLRFPADILGNLAGVEFPQLFDATEKLVLY